jgi:polygalacturonase
MNIFGFTGANGTIDGQGELWWTKFRAGELNHTRPYLIEIMFSTNIQISNLTLINSPSWNVHPVYCRYSFLSLIVASIALYFFSVDECP